VEKVLMLIRTRLAGLAAAGAIAVVPVAALAIGSATTPINAQTRESLIAAKTLVRIEMLQTVSSAFSKKGDVFTFAVVDNVMAGNRVAIPAGAQGTGKVLDSRRAHMAGEDGFLKVKFDPLALADGTKVELAITRDSLIADENEKNGLASSIDEVASAAVPGFFLIDLLRKGSEVTLGAQRPFHVAVTEDAFLSDSR
jgi:hypothetical protein